MSWRNIRLIFWREVSDQLRDRRTLFMVLVLPILLYPALGWGMLQMTLIFSEQPKQVVILGAKDLPKITFLKEGKFDGRYFENPKDVSILKLITDDREITLDDKASPEEIEQARIQRDAALIAAEKIKHLQDEIELLIPELPEVEREKIKEQNYREVKSVKEPVENTAADGLQASEINPTEAQEKGNTKETVSQEKMTQYLKLRQQQSAMFSQGNIHVLLIIPENFASDLEAENHKLILRDNEQASASVIDRVKVIRNSVDEKSVAAYVRLREALKTWELLLLNDRLKVANLPADFSTPVNPLYVDIANSKEIAANIWSKLFPTLIIMMSVTGAFYPAVDIGAGEKERGTMETLLICPATRTEIVIGKFFTVMLFSLSTALLNLVSMGFTSKYMLTLAGGGQMSRLGDPSLPGWDTLFFVMLLTIPLSSLFSSLSLAFAIFAKSTKEGQYYLTPLLLVTMGITVFCLSPGVEINPFYSVLPVMGPALLLKALLIPSVLKLKLLAYAIPVMGMSILYSLVSLAWAIDQFKREEVLFREGERFELRLWLRQLMREKGPIPSFWEGLFCFLMIMLLQLMSTQALGEAFTASKPDEQGLTLVKLLIVQQLAIIGTPAVMMALFLTTNLRETLRLNWPSLRFLLLGILLPLCIHPLSLELLNNLNVWFFPPLPESIKSQLQTISDDNIPYFMIILAFSVAPAICEELAFRGFILSGFMKTRRIWLAIVLSSLLFGIMHMIPQQVFNASVLGLVLGLLAVKSNSILPGMIYHLINNIIGVAETKYINVALVDNNPWLSNYVYFGARDNEMHFTAWTLLIAGLCTGMLLLKLVREPTPRFGVLEAAAPSTHDLTKEYHATTRS